MNHSPLPWTLVGPMEVETDGSRFLGEPRRTDWFVAGEIAGKPGRTIAQVGGWTDRPNVKEDAAYIVQACNLYPELVDALTAAEVALQWSQSKSDTPQAQERHQTALDQARAVLDKRRKREA